MTHIPATPEEIAEARELISRLCEEMLPDDGQLRLEQLMRGHRRIRVLYLGLIQLHSDLRQRASSLLARENELREPAGMNDAMILPALRLTPSGERADEVDATAASPVGGSDLRIKTDRATVSGSARSTSRALPSIPARARSRRFTFWFGMAAAILLSLAIAAVRMLSTPASSATLTNAVDARFAEGHLSTAVGTALPSGRQVELARGFIELTLDGGARVVVEAPASFSVDSPAQMTLSSGKISALASGTAHGFQVLTPSATIVDLGTEFGVSVDASQATQVQVFQGKVLASPRSDGASGDTVHSQTVLAGDAAEISSGAVRRKAGAASAQAFVRTLAPVTSPIDLVDLVAGGDGTTHRRKGQIDPRSGKTGELKGFGKMLEYNWKYQRIPSLSVFDGCFVPGRSTQVDSDGHQFDFPNTGKFGFYYITAAGVVDWPVKGDVFQGVLGGVDYSQLPHGFILMHSNCGLTLDLAALRRLHPGLGLSHFAAVTGNTYRKPPGSAQILPKADVYILVDGISRFQRRTFTPEIGAIPIDVPLQNADRFLTLVVTDGGDDRGRDWVIFGDPRLE